MDINEKSIKQMIRFLVVGVGATLIHYIIYILLGIYVNNNIAYTVGYIISFVFNFIVSNYFTFNTAPTKKRGIRFIFAHGFNYLLQMILLNVYMSIGVERAIAPFLVYAICVPINFLLVKKALKN